MSSTWTEFLHDSAPPEHGVCIYQDVEELAGSVGAYLASGFDIGEPAVVIAVPAHWARCSERLAVCGWDPAAIESQGLLWVLDAETTLARFMVDAKPSAEQFEDIVGGLLDEVQERFPGRRVRAFGEMVDLLTARGEGRAASQLEDLWHRLLARRCSFTLLCGYELDPFDRTAQVSVLPDICRAHSHVQPAESSEQFQLAVDSALEEVLGSDANKVYALAAATGRGKCVPAGQLALMWASAYMPTHAERVLAGARSRYQQAVAVPAG